MNPSGVEPDGDVIYLGTKPHGSRKTPRNGVSMTRNTIRAPTTGRTPNARTSPSASSSRSARSAHRLAGGGSTAIAPRPRTRPKSRAPRPTSTSPPYMVGRLVRLGWSRRPDTGRQVVYGSFSSAGRLCCRADLEEAECSEGISPRIRSVRIAHKDIDYNHHFRGMRQHQVRAKVYQLLEENFMVTGEI